MTFLISNHYNYNNGDRAVLEATIQKINTFFPHAKIIVSAYDPSAMPDDSRFEIVGWPVKKQQIYKKICNFLLKKKLGFIIFAFAFLLLDKNYRKALKSADCVFISGGHHFTDILGRSNLYSLSINLFLPTLKKKKVILLPQSIGPISNAKDANFVNCLLNKTALIAVRDKASIRYLENNKISTKFLYVPDVVFGLDGNIKNTIIQKGKIGVALYCNYQGQKKETLFPRIIQIIKDTIQSFCAKGYEFSFIPMETIGTENDDRIVAKSIIDSLDEETRKKVSITEPCDNSVISVVDLFSANDLILAFKTHSVVFSCLSHTPLVGIAYHPKSIEFMEEIGLGEYAINDFDLSFEKLINIMNNALTNAKQIVSTQSKGIRDNVSQIDCFFEKETGGIVK